MRIEEEDLPRQAAAVSRLTFRERLAVWRESRSLSQRDVDRAIDRMGYTSQLERGKLRAPSKEDCHAIANLLGMDPELVWQVAAPERLESFDPALYEWHQTTKSAPGLPAVLDALDEETRTALDRVAPELTVDELSLIEALRRRRVDPGAALRLVEAAQGLRGEE